MYPTTLFGYSMKLRLIRDGIFMISPSLSITNSKVNKFKPFAQVCGDERGGQKENDEERIKRGILYAHNN